MKRKTANEENPVCGLLVLACFSEGRLPAERRTRRQIIFGVEIVFVFHKIENPFDKSANRGESRAGKQDKNESPAPTSQIEFVDSQTSKQYPQDSGGRFVIILAASLTVADVRHNGRNDRSVLSGATTRAERLIGLEFSSTLSAAILRGRRRDGIDVCAAL